MNLFDDIPIGPSGPKRNLTPAENIAAAICFLLLPTAVVGLLMVTDLSKRPDIAMLWIPSVSAALAIVVCAALSVRFGRALMTVLGTVWWCFAAGTTMVVIDILVFPF